MTMSSPVVFFGTEQFSVPSLEALIDAGYPVAFVVTKPDSRRGRGQQIEQPQVKKIALRHNIPVLQPTRISDILEPLQKLDHPIGVLVAYGKIIPQSIIDCFTPGIINVHPSLLPGYRGPSPLEAALLHGDRETGISIMKLSADMDAGPVYVQEKTALTGNETRTELYESMSARGAQLLMSVLPSIIDDNLVAVAQDTSKVSYCSLLKKDDGIMDIEHKTAEKLEQEVRAYQEFPKSRLFIYGSWTIVTESHVVVEHTPDEPLILSCAHTTYLAIDELIAPSGKKMNAAAFIRGVHNKD